MTDNIITTLLLLVGLINFAPVLGAISAQKMANSYGVDLQDPNLAVLMRHRALLFGIVGGFIIYAAWHPVYQPMAFLFGLAGDIFGLNAVFYLAGAVMLVGFPAAAFIK